MRLLLTEIDQSTLIDQTINDFFERSIDYATRIDPSYRQLWELLYGLIRSGGKRLRPKMTIMAYEAFGGKELEKIIPVAVAQELLHFSLLIHDDVIDRDYTRYGVPNIAGRYKVAYSKYVNSLEDQTHYAHSAAILGGDLMLSGAYQLIASSELDDKEKMLAQSYLANSIFEVVGGELLDIELSFAPYANGDALKVAKYKTASYSFVSPILIGALLGGIKSTKTEVLRSYATSLGVAYQLVDDQLGLFGSENKTGKSTSSDIVEGKRTYMVEQALASLTDSEKSAFMRAFGNPQATPVEIEYIKQLLEKSGAREATQRKINEYCEHAKATLDTLELDKIYYDKFATLITNVTERSS
ncbi:MAG: polyprenyl synthetase family protein [Candidatus Saccharimonadales bacterium]